MDSGGGEALNPKTLNLKPLNPIAPSWGKGRGGGGGGGDVQIGVYRVRLVG